MDKVVMKELNTKLNSIIKELSDSSFKLDYEERFDVASLRNNIYNVKISFKIDYLYTFYESYPASKLVNNFNYLKDNNPESFIIKNYVDVEALKAGIVEIVTALYLNEDNKKHDDKWIEKHLKPVIAFEKINLITMFRKENRNKETIKMVLLGNHQINDCI